MCYVLWSNRVHDSRGFPKGKAKRMTQRRAFASIVTAVGLVALGAAPTYAADSDSVSETGTQPSGADSELFGHLSSVGIDQMIPGDATLLKGCSRRHEHA